MAGATRPVTGRISKYSFTILVAPLPKGSWHGERSNAVTEGYEYAVQFVFYNILFYFNTSYPPFNVSPSLRKS